MGKSRWFQRRKNGNDPMTAFPRFYLEATEKTWKEAAGIYL